jgi:hypothetical protein
MELSNNGAGSTKVNLSQLDTFFSPAGALWDRVSTTDTILHNTTDALGIGGTPSTYLNFSDLKVAVQANTGKDCNILLNADATKGCTIWMDNGSLGGVAAGGISYDAFTGIGTLIANTSETVSWDQTSLTIKNNSGVGGDGVLKFLQVSVNNYVGTVSPEFPLTNNRLWVLPDAGGVIALVGNITTALSNLADITFINGLYTSTVSSGVLAGNITLTLPTTTGILALTSQIPTIPSDAQEQIAGLADGQTSITIAHTPLSDASFKLYRNGLLCRLGYEYSRTTTTVTWSNSGGVTILSTDSIIAVYQY